MNIVMTPRKYVMNALPLTILAGVQKLVAQNMTEVRTFDGTHERTTTSKLSFFVMTAKLFNLT